jgi:RNA polymerase sigma-70 factor (ECF subfamily)
MIISKSEEAFHALYASQAGGVRRFLQGMVGGNHHVAEELMQDAFIKAWKALPTFAFKSTLKTWVYTVALNTARDWLRSHAGKTFVALDPEAHTAMETDTPEVRAVREALLELDEETRALLMLHYYEDLDLYEIAKILGIPQGTVKSRLFTAKGKLRPKLIAKGFNV